MSLPSLYEEIFRSASDGIVVIDSQATIVAANDELSRIFGYQREELLRNKLGILLPSELRTQHDMLINNFINGLEERRRVSSRLNLIGQHRDGTIVPVEITIAKVRTECGVFASAIVRDVSIRQGIEMELRVTREELKRNLKRHEELDRLKDHFLGMAAHDLRNPLNRIGLAATVLRDDENLTEERKRMADVIIRTVAGMSGLINDLLDVNKIEQGRIVLRFKETFIVDYLKEQIDLAKIVAAKKNIAVTLDATTANFSAEIDADRLQQVVENLLSNAIKFSQPGSPVRVDLSFTEKDWTCLVIDHGPGLSETEQQRLFVPFSQLGPKPTAGEASTGLGLAISKRIIDLHHGTLGVQSMRGEGSTFYFTLPRKVDQRDP